LSRKLYRAGTFRVGLRSAELCVLTGLALYVFGTEVTSAQVPLSIKDLVATMLTHEDYEEAHKGNYIYLSKERSERTGGHLWTERIAEIGAGKIRMLIAEDNLPLGESRKTEVMVRLNEIATHPDVFQKQEEARKKDEQRAKEMLDLLPKAYLFSNAHREGSFLRVDFQPNPNYTPQSIEERVLHAMTGSMLIDQSQARLHELNGRLPEDISIGFGLIATFHAGSSFSTMRNPVPGNEWKTAVIDTDITGRAMFFKSIGKKEHVEHSEFRQIANDTTVAQAIQMLKK
jgi:hypothetical protein